MTPSSDRLQQIAAMYAKHADELRDLMRRRAGGAHGATIDDACSFAWTQLTTAEHIDVRPPRWSALAWLTTTAMRKAWEMTAGDRRATAHDHGQLDTIATARGLSDASADERAALQIAASSRVGSSRRSPHLFRCDVTELVVVSLPDPPEFLVIEAWHEGRGVTRSERR